jgi:hypothetical protein
VLPRRANGLTFDFEFEGHPVRYLYHVGGDRNPYRRGGMLVSRRVFGEALDHEANLVEIFI